MTITLEIPDQTAAAVITLLTSEGTEYIMSTKMLGSDMIKDGAEFKVIPYEQQKERNNNV